MFSETMLAGKRVLITGGGTGLGKTVGRRAVELGAELTIVGRRAEVLSETAAEFDALGQKKTTAIACDIREGEAVAQMMDQAWQAGPQDVVVNNAAGTMLARSETLSSRAVDAVLRVSLHGATYVSLEAGRRWIADRRPGLLMYTLAAGFEDGRPFMLPLTVAKGGLLTLLRTLAVEWGPRQIRTVGVAPGNFPTPGAAAKLQAGRTADPAPMIPLGRVGQHSELADLYAFLMSDLATYISGEAITIDGAKGLRTNGVDDLMQWTPEQWDALRPKKG
ncbi:putative 2,4-dienoyl-CoA reductase (plasmid) [Variovorax sp. SRS16]|uniref:SDR family oxidoreductase n=1 Tax=Variovorax sp. SRS16 TaxID=282217 RepID=UPI001318E934|nr:SDR family oxidoreductase [Variovorax sp. SRS16]VTU45802.1 putative 2,4-dienoyl-CoA reductase [Variovorax sp. SRS16]